MNKNTVLVAVVLAVAVFVAAWYFMWRKPTAPAAPAAQGLGADIYNQVAPNAAANLPETNPYKAVQTNPFAQ